MRFPYTIRTHKNITCIGMGGHIGKYFTFLDAAEIEIFQSHGLKARWQFSNYILFLLAQPTPTPFHAVVENLPS